MSWLLLAVAILAEVIGTIFLKLSDGLSRLLPTLVMTVLYITSFALLGLSIRKIDLAVAYAIWAGLGTALVTIAGFWLFSESITPMKVISIALIIAGVVGLKLA